jgi:hypothetical protein
LGFELPTITAIYDSASALVQDLCWIRQLQSFNCLHRRILSCLLLLPIISVVGLSFAAFLRASVEVVAPATGTMPDSRVLLW